MENNVFGPLTQDSIRVGYIDPDFGYVKSVSVLDANRYAKKNPGTVFVFRDGDNNVRYLNINEVNALKPESTIPNTDNCGGIANKIECGPPKLQIFGGGGVGANGNLIVGSDGSILAVDLVDGGYGYKFIPNATVQDDCDFGSGAVLRVELGEVSDGFQYFESEEDFEDYIIPPESPVNYGSYWGPNGESLGDWNPSIFSKTGADPIELEVREFQRITQLVEKPFFSTRKFRPTNVTSSDTRVIPSYNQVSLGEDRWHPFLSKYGISPTAPSNVPGTDYGAVMFSFEWDLEFPVTGEYIFTGNGDGTVRKVYLDNKVIGVLASYDKAPKTIKKTIKRGFYRLRIDLQNGSIEEEVPAISRQIESVNLVDVNFNVYGQGKRTDQLKFSFTSSDGSHSFVIRGVANSKDTRTDTVKVKPNTTYNVVASTLRQNGFIEQGTLINKKKNKEGGLESSNTVFADFIESANDNDDMQLTCKSGIFTPTKKVKSDIGRSTYKLTFKVDVPQNQLTTSKSVPSTTSNGSNTNKIFNTLDYISRADRTLWRLNPSASSSDGFISQYGISPFDTTTKQARTDDFSGTHVIRWEKINFPIDGLYRIRVGVDDSVKIYIGNRSGGGRVEIGNGLTDINSGGDEVIIEKKGFVGDSSTGTGILEETKFFQAGNYRIRAELFQKSGSPLAKGNPMALAIDIEAVTAQKVISAKSWFENPMGVSLTIDAPSPPVPQEIPPVQTGICPPNPIWSTRFPRSQQQWYPVKYDPDWSNFMNRYAMSPVKALKAENTDAAGVTFSNTWEVDIPYRGFYGVKGTVDNEGKVFIDGKEVYRLRGFRQNNPPTEKVLLEPGKHQVTVEVYNIPQIRTKVIDAKIFSTIDWQTPAPIKSSENAVQTSVASNLKVKFVEKNGRIYIETTGTGQGEVKFLLDIDDNPFIAGPAATEILIPSDSGKIKFKRDMTKSQEKIKNSGNFTAGRSYGPIEIVGAIASAGRSVVKSNRVGLLDADGTDENIKLTVSEITNGTIDSTSISGSTVSVGGIISGTVKSGVNYEGPPLIRYTDKRWGSVMNKYCVCPIQDAGQDLSSENPNINGVKTLLWRSVDFPETGNYEVTFLADDRAKLFVGENKVLDADGTDAILFANKSINVAKGKYNIRIEVENIKGATDIFLNNPTGVVLDIRKKITVPDPNSPSWTSNPMAASAILIAPPCPRPIKGKGVVSNIVPLSPGNGYIAPVSPNQQYPVTLKLKEVVVNNPGINYNCGVDQIQITPSNGAVLSYSCNAFGKVTAVNVVNPGVGFTAYPVIDILSDTGVNADFTPVFEIVRDPVEALTGALPEESLIQVTDLVGLTQNGYVGGRPYYGSVFFKDGIRYAGYYETAGQLVQVYATLQESITGEITTRPSAIQRSGTTVNSNNQQLNIPGTPSDTI